MYDDEEIINVDEDASVEKEIVDSVEETPVESEPENVEESPDMDTEESSEKRDFDRPQREMHEVICAECGQPTEVPFKPDGSRPVYCQDCYRKNRPPRY